MILKDIQFLIINHNKIALYIFSENDVYQILDI